MHMRTVEIAIAAITEGQRRREDYGDIDALAASIARHGLLHPIVVDSEYRLVAGGRRLRAVRQLGMSQIAVRLLGSLSDAEVQVIELEENLQRKDLTAAERSRNLVALVETAKAVAAETPEDFSRVSEGKRGPAQEPTSDVRIAERIGVAPVEIRNARAHVAAVEAHPEVVDVSQSTAITYAKAVEAQPELKGQPIPVVASDYRAKRNAMRAEREREEAVVRERQQHQLAVADPKGILARNELRETYRRHLAAMETLLAMKPHALIPALNDADRTHIESYLPFIREWCDGVEAVLAPGPRSMRG